MILLTVLITALVSLLFKLIRSNEYSNVHRTAI